MIILWVLFCTSVFAANIALLIFGGPTGIAVVIFELVFIFCFILFATSKRTSG